MMLGLESWTLARPELFLAAVTAPAADLRRGPRRSGDAVRVDRHLARPAGDGGAAVRALSRGHGLLLAVHRRPADHHHEGAGPGRLGHRHPDVARLFRAGQGLALRVSAAGRAGDARHDADDLGQRPDGALCRPRAAVAGALRHRRLPARQRPLDRGRREVFRPGLGRLGHAAVRRLADLRLLRRHGLRADLAGADRRQGRRDRRHHRPGVRGGGPGLQGLGRAVPHVDARRLRGRADAGDGPVRRRRRRSRPCR